MIVIDASAIFRIFEFENVIEYLISLVAGLLFVFFIYKAYKFIRIFIGV